MGKKANGSEKKSVLSKFSLAAIILMLVFLVVGASTMGVFNSPGKSYRVYKDNPVVFYLDYDANSQTGLAKVYLNIGSVYTEIGEEATVTMQYSTGTSSTISWSSGTRMGARKIGNIYTVVSNTETGEDTYTAGYNYNWTCLYDMESSTLSSSYRLIRLSVSQETIVNEVVFLDKDGKIIPAYTQVDEKLDKDTSLDDKLKSKYTDSQYPTVRELFRKNDDGASNLTDRQNNLTKLESWRCNFTEDEMYTLMQIDNLFLGHSAEADSVYNGDTDFGSLATLLVLPGVLIFGKSTFGLRLMPLVYTVLLIGLIYVFMRRLLKNDGFGFLSALLFAFGGIALTAGRLGAAFSALALLMVGCYYLMYRFYEKGIDGDHPVRSALNVLCSGFCFAGAFAIWSNSWIIALGAVVLFALGLVKMYGKQKNTERLLVKELSRKNSAETDKEIMQANMDETEALQQKSAAAFAYHVKVSVVFFFAAFALGTFLAVVLSVLPAYLSYVRIYDNPASPQMSFFALMSAMLKDTQSVSNITSHTYANAANAFSWLIGFKGATAYSVSAESMYNALNVQNNILMTLTALIGFVVSTVYVAVYFAAGGRDNPEYSKNFKKIGRTYLVLTLGSLLALIAFAVVPSSSAIYSMLFYAFYLGYIPLLGYISYVHDKSEKTVFFKKYRLNNTLKILCIAIALYAIVFVASVPMYFGIGLPLNLARILFGWTSLANNGLYR